MRITPLQRQLIHLLPQPGQAGGPAALEANEVRLLEQIDGVFEVIQSIRGIGVNHLGYGVSNESTT